MRSAKSESMVVVVAGTIEETVAGAMEATVAVATVVVVVVARETKGAQAGARGLPPALACPSPSS